MERETVKEESELLVKKSQDGSVQAFEQLIKSVERSLFLTARALLCSDYDADDVFQNTVLAVYRKIGSLREPRYFKTWATRILINECKNVIRVRNQVVTIEDNKLHYLQQGVNKRGSPGRGAQSSPVGRGSVDLDTDLEQVPVKMELYEALKKMTFEQRQVIVLKYYLDMTIKDIADILDLPEGTIKSRIYYGLRSLRGQLKKGREVSRNEM